MKFGIFYVLECPDHDFTRAYREMLEQISYAEKLGFDEVWLAEHHAPTTGLCPLRRSPPRQSPSAPNECVSASR